MATETGPDLTVAKEAVEALMDDTCTVASPEASDVLDTGTGIVTSVPGTELYDGRCKVRPRSEARPLVLEEGGASQVARHYAGAVPLEAGDFPIGSILTLTSSRRDPELVGRQFRIDEVQYSTFAIQRKLVLELRELV